ncbi:MAG: hypothetical protein PVI97_12795 [Candidatus Thiodiazotropha sp.]
MSRSRVAAEHHRHAAPYRFASADNGETAARARCDRMKQAV